MCETLVSISNTAKIRAFFPPLMHLFLRSIFRKPLVVKKKPYLLCFLQLERELEVCEKESGELQEYANSVLQQIADYCPDILEQVVNALEESC